MITRKIVPVFRPGRGFESEQLEEKGRRIFPGEAFQVAETCTRRTATDEQLRLAFGRGLIPGIKPDETIRASQAAEKGLRGAN